MVAQKVIDDFGRDGFGIARGLFKTEEAEYYAKYFTDMVERGGNGWAEGGVHPESLDPLQRYPRLLQPHRGDDVAFHWMIEPRIREHLKALCGEEPYAVQTMVYFKAPGARGQNLHQDNMYLLVQPGTCIAAWMALDDCDEENGCMALVPGTKDLPMICQHEIEGLNERQWGNVETPIPPGARPVPAIMKKGDVLFFNGSVIHGSWENRSKDRFRRTMIGHYISAETKQVAKYYFPVFRLDGSRLDDDALIKSQEGGPCGVYEELDVAMKGHFKTWEAAH